MSAGIVIGLTGQAGAGKDTCGQILQEAGFAVTSFAARLYAEVAEQWRVDVQRLAARDTKELPMGMLSVSQCCDAAFVQAQRRVGMLPSEERQARSPRWLLQQWGSYRRARQATYWVEPVMDWAQHQRSNGVRHLCVTDVRHWNELNAIQALGGRLLRVHRPDRPGLPADTRHHVSEQHLPADDTVHNDGDLQHLRAELARVISPWGGSF